MRDELGPGGVDADQWVSASKTRNWAEEDLLLDWLDLYGELKGFVKDSQRPDYIPAADFSAFLMRKGREFEAKVMALLEAKLGPFPRVVKEYGDQYSHERFDETVSLMRQGVPVMAQGVLWDFGHKTFGAPDLLVRSDFLDKLCRVDPEHARCGAPGLGHTDFHYVVVDIKFKGFKLDSNREVNNEAAKYKVQACIYNAALAEIQGYESPRAYFIGRSWSKGTGKSKVEVGHCFDRLLPVTLPVQTQRNKPAIDWQAKADEAANWIRDVRSHGAGWEVLPKPTDPRLYPDVGNTQDSPWHKAKKEIAAQLDELTRIWQIGAKARNHLHTQGHNDWRNPDFDRHLPQEGDSIPIRRAKMLEVNRSVDGPLWYPSRIDWKREEWAKPEALEFFVDFETTSNLDDDFASLPEKGGQPLIFMIGCGHYDAQGNWQFKVFTTDALTESAEAGMILEWSKHMQEVQRLIPNSPESPKVFHWSPAETRTYKIGQDSAFKRHLEPLGWPEPNWYDFLVEVIKPSSTSDAFFVKGAWGFGLKAIGNALHSHGLITTKWADGPGDGLEAMSGAWACYRAAAEQGIRVEDVELVDASGKKHLLFPEIVDYNEVDCRVMAECINFVRSPC